MTYRATVRRGGVYTGASGPRDFNAELTEPIYKQLASTWEKIFQRRLPNILQAFKRQATNVVKQFHVAIEGRTREKGAGAARLNMLAQQLDQYSATFGDLCTMAVTYLNEGQREINREFVPAITAAMEPAYDAAAAESGTGAFRRMKGYVNGHLDNHKEQMFHSASEQVRESLLKLCKRIKDFMLGRADDIYLLMHRDYTSVLNGVNVGDIKMSREERVARREVDRLITAADKHFQSVIDTDLEGLQVKFEPSVKKEEASDDFPDIEAFSEKGEDEDDNNGTGEEGLVSDTALVEGAERAALGGDNKTEIETEEHAEAARTD